MSEPEWAFLVVSIARRRFVVLRPIGASCHVRRSICAFQSPAGDSLSCDINRGLMVALMVKKFQSPAGDSSSCDLGHALGSNSWRAVFQSPAGDSLSCDGSTTAPVATAGLQVSIARRRFVVLRLGLVCASAGYYIKFQSPAGDSLSCDTGLKRLGESPY